jgi:site-specific recombinase XerD
MKNPPLHAPNPLPLALPAEQREALARTARELMARSRADSTLQLYRRDWRAFVLWCEGHGLPSLPATPDTICLYLADLADRLKPSTIGIRLAAISQAHQAAGHESPTLSAPVRAVLRGIRRAKGIAPAQKEAISTALRAMVATIPDTLVGSRDRAILFLGFASSCRRSCA